MYLLGGIQVGLVCGPIMVYHVIPFPHGNHLIITLSDEIISGQLLEDPLVRHGWSNGDAVVKTLIWNQNNLVYSKIIILVIIFRYLHFGS
jgi:hypothetical protein